MKKGFTLIELLVVVLIIGILSAIALPQYSKAVWKTRFVQAKLLANDIWKADQLYRLENDALATKLTDLAIEMPGSCWATGCNINNGTLWLDESQHEIMVYLTDKDSNQLFGYKINTSTGEHFCKIKSSVTGSNLSIFQGICSGETGVATTSGKREYKYP